MNKKDLEFLYEIGTLSNMQRGWGQHIKQKVASVSEHMFRVMWLALIISRMEKAGDENKIIKMAMSHDLAETRTSDLSYVQKVYAHPDETSAFKDLFNGTTVENFYADVVEEYEKRESVEAKIVKDADNLEVDLEMAELQANGFAIPKEWNGFRKDLRDKKLYTESAKKIWDEIQGSNINDWHVKANKWLKISGAGR
jgi:putative hydrolase of HD superfamily